MCPQNENSLLQQIQRGIHMAWITPTYCIITSSSGKVSGRCHKFHYTGVSEANADFDNSALTQKRTSKQSPATRNTD